jgi:hypothetical protein
VHVNGTVQAISSGNITVLSKRGETVSFIVDQTTRVLGDAGGGTPPTIASVTQHMRVNVVGRTDGNASVPTARRIVILGADDGGQGTPKSKGQQGAHGQGGQKGKGHQK